MNRNFLFKFYNYLNFGYQQEFSFSVDIVLITLPAIKWFNKLGKNFILSNYHRESTDNDNVFDV